MKRTALYICYFATDEPLVHTQVLPYLGAVARAGVSMHLLTFERRSRWLKDERARRRELKRRLAAEGINWHALKYHKRPSLAATAFDIVAGVAFSAWLVVRHRIRIVHARAHIPGVIGLAMKVALRAKLIFDLRGLMAEEYVDNGVWTKDSLPFRMAKAAERALLKYSDRLVVLTEKLRTILTTASHRQVDPAKIFVIPCCVDLRAYDKTGLEPVRDRLTLVYAGSTAGLYLTGQTIEFFKVLRMRREDAQFLILTKAGEGDLKRLLEQKGIDDSAYSIISAAPDEVPEIIRRGHIGVSLRKPGFAQVAASPTKIGEYLAAGLPVVSTSCGDTDAVLRAEEVGVIIHEFGAADYERAADQVLELLARGDVSERCRRAARTHYSLAEVGGPRYVAVYRSLGDETFASDDLTNADANSVLRPSALRKPPNTTIDLG